MIALFEMCCDTALGMIALFKMCCDTALCMIALFKMCGYDCLVEDVL